MVVFYKNAFFSLEKTYTSYCYWNWGCQGCVYLRFREKICNLYLQKCDSFETTIGTIWQIKCHIHCHSLNTIYYLVCSFCLHESNVGKTDNLRERTNNHISCCRYGTGSDLFGLHVHECARKQGKILEEKPFIKHEPYFKLFAFMTLSNYNSLRNHERRLQLQGHDTINKPNSWDKKDNKPMQQQTC